MKRGRAGFTLLEMVVSLTILAGIAAFLVVAFRLAGGSIERGAAEGGGRARVGGRVGVVRRVGPKRKGRAPPGGPGRVHHAVPDRTAQERLRRPGDGGRGRMSSKGIAQLVVLWALLLLGTLAMSFAFSLRTEG